jgi:hypothetical protein
MREVPASIGQRLLWFLDHYRGAGGALNCPVLLRIHGPLDLQKLQRVLDRLTARHEALRTTFSGRGRHLTQVIHEPRSVGLRCLELSASMDADQAVREAIACELRTNVDPQHWPVRATLWRLDPADHVLCFNMHHLVSDGWSCGLIVRDLHLLYGEARAGEAELPPVDWQYADFVRWQQEQLEGATLRDHQEYWRRQLTGARVPTLPVIGDRGDIAARRTAREAVDLDAVTSAALRELARTRRTTLFNIMLSVYYALLHRATGDGDLTVASVFANRARPELQHTVGFFANLLLLRTVVDASDSFSDLLIRTHQTVMQAFLHQAVPYYMLPGGLVAANGFRPDDLVFQMMTKSLFSARLGSASVEALLEQGVGNRFELEMAIITTERKLTVVISYHTARLDADWARDFIYRYAALARAVAAHPDVPLETLPD